MENLPIISLQNVSKTYTIFDYKTDTLKQKIWSVFAGNSSRQIKALNNINLDIQKGEFFGVIGHNGSGKSTLLNIIAKAIKPDKGGVVIRNGSYMRLSLGMGFSPELSAIQNAKLNASILGIPLKELNQKISEIITFAELEDFKNTQIKFFSSGMRARLAFAVAVLANAEIFLMDEFFGGVGDEKFKAKAEKVFQENLVKGRTVVHVSHSMSNIEKYCTRVLVLNKGEMVGIYNPEEAIKVYKELMNSKNKKNKL